MALVAFLAKGCWFVYTVSRWQSEIAQPVGHTPHEVWGEWHEFFFESGNVNHTVFNKTSEPNVHVLFEILPTDHSGPS